MQEWNCTTIARDKVWFEKRAPDLKAFWDLVLKFREEGVPEKYLKSSRKNEPGPPGGPVLSPAPPQRTLSINRSTGHVSTTAGDPGCMFWDSDDE